MDQHKQVVRLEMIFFPKIDKLRQWRHLLSRFDTSHQKLFYVNLSRLFIFSSNQIGQKIRKKEIHFSSSNPVTGDKYLLWCLQKQRKTQAKRHLILEKFSLELTHYISTNRNTFNSSNHRVVVLKNPFKVTCDLKRSFQHCSNTIYHSE